MLWHNPLFPVTKTAVKKKKEKKKKEKEKKEKKVPLTAETLH